MPPILIDQQGDQLIFQNDDGSTFPVAASGLSQDYMSKLSSGMPLPTPKDQLIGELSQNTGGMSSVLNPGPLDYAAQRSWQNDLLKRGASNVSPEELAAFNAAKTQGPSVSFGGQPLGTNIVPAPSVEMPSEIPSELPALPKAPSVAPQKEQPSELEKGFSQQAKGIKQEYEGMAKAADESARLYKSAADEFLATQTKMQAIQEEATKKTDEQLKLISEAQDAYNKMEVKNPWAEMSTGSKIGAALAIGLGAYSSSINGGPNQAYQIINDAMNRDISIQMKQIEKKGQEISSQKDYLGLIRSATNDKMTQALMLKDLKLSSIENQIKGFESSAKSAEASGKMNQLLGRINQERQAVALDIAQRQATLGKTYAEMNATAQGKPELQVPGLGVAYAAEDAKTLRQLRADVEGASRGIDRLLEISKVSGKSLSPEMRREADTLRSTLQGQLRTALVGPGAVNESERALMERAISDPTAFFSLDSTNSKALETLKEALNNKIESAAQSSIQNYKPGSYKGPKIVTIANGAQFQIVDGNPVPLNEQARQIVAAKAAASGR